jgi:hypothetical protein
MPPFTKALASLRRTPESMLQSDVMTEPEFREFVSSLERFVVAAAEGALRGEGEGDEGAKGAAPKYEGALRVAVDADVLGDKWRVATGPSDLPYTVRVSVRVASKVAGASARDSVEDAADWQSREAGARKLKSAKGVAREAKPWHLSRPLGEVRAGCQLELVRFVVGGFCSAYGLSVNASGEIFVADFNFNMW